MKIVMDIMCSKCHKIFKAELPFTTIGYARGVVRCPHCNMLYHIRVNAQIIGIDITEKDLDDYEQWLTTEKKLLSAHEYRRQVEKFLKTGELPKKLTALNHLQEYMRKKKHKEIPIL